MISLSAQEIKKRSQYLARNLKKRGIPVRISEGTSLVGGGSLHGKSLPTYLISVETEGNIDELDSKLRMSYPAVLGRVKDNNLFFDPRTIDPSSDKELIELKSAAFYQKNEQIVNEAK